MFRRFLKTSLSYATWFFVTTFFSCLLFFFFFPFGLAFKREMNFFICSCQTARGQTILWLLCLGKVPLGKTYHLQIIRAGTNKCGHTLPFMGKKIPNTYILHLQRFEITCRRFCNNFFIYINFVI